jgi:hypothetical protein
LRARKQGAVVRVLTPVTSENFVVAQELSELVELRHLDKHLKGSFVSLDGRELVMVESRPDDLKTNQGFGLAIWTTNRIFIELYDQFFDRIWNTASGTKLRTK